MFWKDNAFVTLLLPPPLHPKSDTCYVINRTSKRFGKIPFRIYLPPCTPKWPSLSYKSNIWMFRKHTLSLSYSPPPAPQEWHSLSHISNIIKPHPTWKNHSEPLRIILFRNISERCAFIILLPPSAPQKWWLFWNISKRYAFVTLLPLPHCTPKWHSLSNYGTS